MNHKTRYWDGIGEEFSKERLHLWRNHCDAANIKLLEQWLPKEPVERLVKTDVFDEALSDGLYPLLASRARTVIGMDISVVTLKAAATLHNGLHAVGADARHLPFVDEAFDVIVSNSTLDHFESAEDLVISLHELYRVLKTGGILLITLDNRANPIVALRNVLPFRLTNRLGIVPYYVGATFGPRGLRRALQEIGFKISEVGTIMHCPRLVAVWAARVLERRVGAETQRHFLKLLMSFERLSAWPTRFLTGYFVAVRATK